MVRKANQFLHFYPLRAIAESFQRRLSTAISDFLKLLVDMDPHVRRVAGIAFSDLLKHGTLSDRVLLVLSLTNDCRRFPRHDLGLASRPPEAPDGRVSICSRGGGGCIF